MKSFKLKTIITIVTIIFSLVNLTFAQDKIYKKNKKEAIEAKVIEIGTGEIKYKLFAEKEGGLVYVIEKSAVEKIEFENGRTEKYGVERIDMEEYFEGQKKQALKVSFLGPLMGTTKITYEKNLKPGRSLELKGSIVGLGFNANGERGFYGSVAYKIYKKPTFVTSDMRRRHILQGAYLKPELFFGGYKNPDFRENDETLGGGGVLLNLGKQWVFGDRIILDVAYGIGYGSGESYRGYLIGENLAMGASLNIGFAF